MREILGADSQAIREKALNAVKKACQLGNEWRYRLRMLLESKVPGKTPGDDDLEVFEQDQDFRTVLGLAMISEET